jgi:hypothetical protein
MREIRLSNGAMVAARALTKRERRSVLQDIDRLSADDLMERVLGMVLAPELFAELEDLPYPDSKAVLMAVWAETNGSRDEEKNSSPAGSGSAAPGGPTTAAPAASAPAGSAPPAAST